MKGSATDLVILRDLYAEYSKDVRGPHLSVFSQWLTQCTGVAAVRKRLEGDVRKTCFPGLKFK